MRGVVTAICTASCVASVASAMTHIKVINNWDGGVGKSDLNVKIHGEGVGGCDIIMHPATGGNATEDDSSCKCLWGTVGYKMYVWLPDLDENGEDKMLRGFKDNSTALPFCSDTSGLGNCYGGHYTCTIGEDKLCHCSG